MYDAIVVGARCAGSPVAMLLARKGYRVLLLDKATFPSDTLSTHHIHQPGIARLKGWGLLEKVQASNCPPTLKIKLDVGPFALEGTPPPAVVAGTVPSLDGKLPEDSVAEAYAPRRRVLDKILVDAAVEAGAELRGRFSVELLTTDGTRVTGIVGRGDIASGKRFHEEARIVIGADGARSLVAHYVKAPTYLDRGMLTCNYYSYWSGVPLEGVELYSRAGRFIVADKTNDGLTIITVVWPRDRFEQIRSNIEAPYLREIFETAPTLFERLMAGKREERFAGASKLPNFLRRPFGDGWALVGDAGYHKDPITAQGITNSFSHAEMLADALDDVLSGHQATDQALREYERKRNEEVVPMFEHTCQLARLEPPPPEMLHLMDALRGNQEDIGRFLGTITGTVPIPEFYSSGNINRLIEAAELKPAA